jgi:phage-related holin
MKRVLLSVFDRFITFDFWTKIALSGVSVVSSFLAPVWPFIFCVVFLVLFDMYTGIKKARRKKEPIRSRNMYRTVEKMLTYISLIIAAEMVNVVFQMPMNLTYIIALPVAMTELYSIMENTEAVSGANIIERIKALVPGLIGSKRKD